jgi:hypothetical protein
VPQILKFVTIFGSNQGYGFTEVHYKQSDSDNPNLLTQLNNFRTNIALKRAQLLGEDVAMVGYRVSYPRQGSTASYGLREFVPGVEGKKGAAAQISLAVNFNDSTYTKSKIVHLRGFWDVIEYDESYHPESSEAAGWEDNLIAWKQALIDGGYGWPSKAPATSSKGDVTNYTSDASGHVTFTLANPSVPLPAVGTVIQVRFSRINDSESILNRQLMVRVAGPLTLVTIKQIGAGPFESAGRYNYRATGFVGYANTGSISLGDRSMGRPLNRTPGRSKAQRLY